jgi:predicted PhzF superfamily epimerase YddE/YHI9
MALEQLKDMIRKGRGNEKVHIVLVEQEQRERIENKGPKPKTRFQIETDDAEMYSALNLEKDRIIRRAKNKSVGISLMHLAWKRLTDAIIDAVLAEEEGPPT